MLAGERMTGEDGVEVCLFPMDILAVTQESGPSEVSHCCGHPCDWAGATVHYPVYAPFSGYVVARGMGNGNTMFYSSDNPVRTPSGDIYVTVQFTHANYGYPPTKTHFTQGELIYYTGTQAERPVGDHLHLDQCPGQDKIWVYYGVTCAWGNACYALPDSRRPNEIFFIDGRETIVTTGSMTFLTGDGTPVIGPTGDGAKLLLLMGSKKIRERRRAYGKSYSGGIFLH